MKFKKEDLQDLIWKNKVYEEITDHSRWTVDCWTVDYWCVFEYEGKHYGVSYGVGATECQDLSPFDYDPEEIECVEMELKEVTIEKWVEKNGN